jgi:hypothetical protein
MAKNLTDKLNTLIRSRMQGAVDDLKRRDRPSKPGKNADRDIAALRQQIDRALDEEDQMTAEIGALQAQIDDWDQQADLALTRGAGCQTGDGCRRASYRGRSGTPPRSSQPIGRVTCCLLLA